RRALAGRAARCRACLPLRRAQRRTTRLIGSFNAGRPVSTPSAAPGALRPVRRFLGVAGSGSIRFREHPVSRASGLASAGCVTLLETYWHLWCEMQIRPAHQTFYADED